MKRLILRLAVSLLAFAVGVVVTLYLTSKPKQPRSETREIQTPQAPSAKVEPFTRIAGTRALAADHTYVDSDLYRAADDSQVSYSRENYRSPAQAARGLRRQLKDAERIIEQLPLKDESGEQIGERTVVLWRPNTRSWARVSILWTRDNESFSINAESLERALEFESSHQEKH